jgi:spermidine synthase
MFKPSFLTRLKSYFWPIILEKVTGDLGHSLEVLVYHGTLMLDTEKVNYSFGSLHLVMKGVLGKLHQRNFPFEHVLILGYGGGSAANIIHSTINPEAQIVGVEADLKVLELTERYFYKTGVKLLHEDAFAYIDRAFQNEWEYDTLIIDIFHDAKIPEFQDDFWLKIKKVISHDGVVVLNTMLHKSEFDTLGLEIRSFGFVTQEYSEIPGNYVWVFKKP